MAESKNHFEFKEDGDNKLHVLMDGKKITTFYYNDFELANRPFLYPIKAPCEEQVTRGYPIEEIEGETKDHIHHTSVWTAWGRVNRIDNWAYGEKNGRQVVKSIQTSNKEDKGIIDLKIQWTTPNGKLQLKENRKICFHASKKPFIIDFDIALTASAGKIKFKDTKEGGFLATRVATSMDVRNGGKIENSNGKVSDGKDAEKNVWGKKAQWCDYSGYVNDEQVGIAILDHPDNPNHPTYWHVRNYGLMAANPFGKSYFVSKWKRGHYKLNPGETIRFRYELVVHDGNAQQAKIDQLYEEFVKNN